MGDNNNNSNKEEWSNRNWQSVNDLNNQQGGYKSAFGFGNNDGEQEGSFLGGLFNAGSSGKIGSGWMQGKNSMALIIVVLVIIIIYTFYTQSRLDAGITKSTIERTRIESVAFDAKNDPFYTDEYGAVEDERALANAANDFYHRTGAIPYVYFMSTGVVPAEAELEQKAEDFYTEHFTDEDHLVIFIDTYSTAYTLGLSIGDNARRVLDDEAVQIFKDFLQKYYAARQTDNQTYMVNTYRYASERMMTTLPFSITNITVGGVAIIVLVSVIIYYIRKRSKEEEKKTEDAM